MEDEFGMPQTIQDNNVSSAGVAETAATTFTDTTTIFASTGNKKTYKPESAIFFKRLLGDDLDLIFHVCGDFVRVGKPLKGCLISSSSLVFKLHVLNKVIENFDVAQAPWRER